MPSPVRRARDAAGCVGDGVGVGEGLGDVDGDGDGDGDAEGSANVGEGEGDGAGADELPEQPLTAAARRSPPSRRRMAGR